MERKVKSYHDNSSHEELALWSKNPNLLSDLRRSLQTWDCSSLSLQNIKEDIVQLIQDMREIFFNGCQKDELKVFIEECIYNEKYDVMFARIKEKYRSNDLVIYRASKKFCKSNGSPRQFGTTVYNFIPNTAVVELSLLSNKRTPLEKMRCLQITYDNIYAEVKGALISVIAKYSEKELDFPTINTKEVTPILLSVILRSKLFYFQSDLNYIKEFGADVMEKSGDSRKIFSIFENALSQILNLDLNHHNSGYEFETIKTRMSVCDTISFTDNMIRNNENEASVFHEERRRIATLITAATTENLEKNG